MKSLVLAEKPSVARDIARVLGCRSGQGCMEGDRYVVTWALGHLVTLADPDVYNDSYKSWKLEDLPILPKKMELVVIKETSKQYGVVKGLLKRGDIGEVIIATDAGREGELVARWILEKAGSTKPVKRLWVSSVTDKAIRDGFKNLKSGAEYVNLYRSAQARAIADWLVGINATRALTTRFNAQLSCGRVQTPTLAIVKAAEDEIKNFKPKKFYGIQITVEGTTFTWRDKRNNSTRMFDKDACDRLMADLRGKAAEIREISKQKKKTYPPKLYDLTELQRDANRMYNYSAKETLNIMQQLYENHKVLTYPRTDSRYLTTDIVPTIPERLRAINGELRPLAYKISRGSIKANENFVDNNKVGDHHAIIPTEQPVSMDRLSDKERRIYLLVVKRFLAVLMPPCEYEECNITAVVGAETFTARGRRIVSPGFREASGFDPEEDDDGKDEPKTQNLPDLKKGNYKVTGMRQTQDSTKPPKPLNEATLLSAMENPAKYITDSGGLGKTLVETGGLGTVATRADIIEKLFDMFAMEKKGNDIWLTSKGRQLLDLVPEDLKKPELTAKWEQELTRISKGAAAPERFLSDITGYTKKIITEIRGSEKVYRHENITTHKCPNCNKNMLEVNGKKGKMLVCQDRECGYRKTVTVLTNARCPNCHKKMELVGDGEHRKFVCVCGFNEKLSAFEARRGDGGMSKRDVENFLRKQNNEQDNTVNKNIADALKGLKFD